MKSERFQERLNEHVALPDWEKRLLPLFLFKGSDPYRLRVLWNSAYAMYLAESGRIGEGVKLLAGERVGHFCGLHKPVNTGALYGIFQRLRGSPQLTDSIDKAFTEYVEWIHPGECTYQRVPLEVYIGNYRKSVHGWWRKPVGWDEANAKGLLSPCFLRAKPKKVKTFDCTHDLAYPYVHKENANREQQLLLDVHAMLPRTIPHEIRGDLCQDLLVAVLTGETTVENIPNVIRKYASKARAIMPDRWKTVSLDALVEGTDGLHIGDRIGADHDHF